MDELFELIERARGQRGRGRETASTQGATIHIEGDRVRVDVPEGASATYDVEQLARALAPSQLADQGRVWPPGVRLTRRIPGGLVVVHETPPGMHTLRWIAKDSPAPYGPEATYRDVQIALPYVVLIAVMKEDRMSRLVPTRFNEVFFATQPIKDLSEPMYYPALLNCSRFAETKNNCLSWLCVQNLPAHELRGDAPNRAGDILRLLLEHLFHTGFNDSSDHHELSSWYAETLRAEVDPRITSIESWQEASAKDPWFPLQVTWLPTELMLDEVLERAIGINTRRVRKVRTADDVAGRLRVEKTRGQKSKRKKKTEKK